MAVAIPGGSGQASFLVTVSGDAEEMVVTLGYTFPEPSTPESNAEQLYDFWSGATSNLPFSPSQLFVGYTFQGVRVRENHGAEEQVGQFLSPAPGTVTGQGLPPNCCILVRKNTAKPGRTGRGRMFMPSGTLGELAVNQAGIVDSGSLAIYQDMFLSAYVNMVGADLVPVLLHENGATATPITSFQVMGKIATQRRRLR